MKRPVFAFFILACTALAGRAQLLTNFHTELYDWNKSLPQITLSDEDKKVSAITLAEKVFTEYTYDEKRDVVQRYYLVHRLRYIHDDRAVEDNNKVYLPMRDEKDFILLKARVFKDGKLLSESDRRDIKTVEENGSTFKIMALKGVTKGCFIENIQAFEIGASYYDDEYLQSKTGVKSYEFTIINPGWGRFTAKLYNCKTDIKPLDSMYQNRRFIYFKVDNVPAQEEEKYSLGNANRMRIELSLYEFVQSKKKYLLWPDIGRRFFERVHENLESNKKDAKKILDKANIPALTTEDEKIAAIENWVKQKINLQNQGDVPENVADIVKKGYTDSYGAAKMMVMMCEAIDIAVELVLSCEKSHKRFDKDFPSYSFARNILLYFPGSKKFIDPGNINVRYGMINSEFLGQQALYIKPVMLGDAMSGVTTVKTIAANLPEESSDFENYTISFKPDNESIELGYHREMHNYATQGIKTLYYLGDDARKKEFIEPFVKSLAKDATLSNLNVENYNLGSYEEWKKPLLISAKLSTGYYCDNAGDKVLFKVGEIIGQQSEMYNEKPRQNPIDLDFCHQYVRTIKINIPKGYKFSGLDKLNINIVFNDENAKPNFGFTCSYTNENGQLIIRCREYYSKLSYDIGQYENFKKVINAAADFNKISILLEKE